MKISFFSAALVSCLVWLAPIFFAFNLAAQTSDTDEDLPETHQHIADDMGRHVCLLAHEAEQKADMTRPPAALKLHAPEPAAGRSANVQLAFQPEENGSIMYETVAGWTNGAAVKAQISILNWVKNLGASNLNLRKITYSYVQNGTTKNKHFYFDTVNIVIAPGQWGAWQNSRKYHEVGHILYLNSPLPTAITISFTFVGETTPTTISMPLIPNNVTFGMPFRAFDLDANEVWEGGSTHGGGGQVFAYDLKVGGLENGVWSSLLPGTNGTQNDHSRIWGKPVYAMADGTVDSWANDVPSNVPGVTGSGGGNFFKIFHGSHEALYAHMIPGSLSDDLMQAGAVVKKGDFLGLAGNSGNSTGPHLHVHIVKLTGTGDALSPCRPLLFHEGWVIQKSSFTTLSNTAPWNKLTGLALPGYAGDRAFIWPSKAKPYFSDVVYTGVFRESASSSQAFFSGLTSTTIGTKNTELEALGMRLTDLNVVKLGTAIKYSGIWRPGTGASTLQKGTTWAAFSSQWSTLSGQGQRLLDLEIYKDANGNLRYAGIYGAGNWGHYLYIGKTQAEFNALWASLGADGFRLVDVEVYNFGGQTLYAGIWKSGGSGGYALWHAGTWASFTSQWADLSADGYRLADMDTDNTGPNTIYSGTFLPGSGGHHLWQHNWNSFVSKWEHLAERGMVMTDINIRPASGATLEGVADEREETAAASPDVEELLLFGPENVSFGAKNTAAAFEVEIFPNPSSDQFTLRADAEILGWTLANALGQTLRSGSGTGETSARVPALDLAPGIYALTVRTAKGVQARQVEKI